MSNNQLPSPGGKGVNVNHNLIRQVQQRAEFGGGDSSDPKTTEYHYHQHFSAAPPAVPIESSPKSNNGKMAGFVIGGAVLILVLIALGSGEQNTVDTEVDIPMKSELEVTPNYTEYRDGIYYYPASISDNDKANGVAASTVHGLRYLGINADGEFVLAPIDQPGVQATCANPCRVIRSNTGEALAYTPNSVIGAAFMDAINGFLEDSSNSSAVEPVVFWDEELDADAMATDAAAEALDAAAMAAEAAAEARAAAIEADAL